MNFNIPAVDIMPYITEVPLLQANSGLKMKGDFNVPGVDITIIYDALRLSKKPS